MSQISQTINQKGCLMYKSNLTEHVNGSVNQIDTMIFVPYIYCVKVSNLSTVSLLLMKRITTGFCKVRGIFMFIKIPLSSFIIEILTL